MIRDASDVRESRGKGNLERQIDREAEGQRESLIVREAGRPGAARWMALDAALFRAHSGVGIFDNDVSEGLSLADRRRRFIFDAAEHPARERA